MVFLFLQNNAMKTQILLYQIYAKGSDNIKCCIPKPISTNDIDDDPFEKAPLL